MSNTPVLLCLNAPAGAGKDTIGSALVSKYNFVRVAFADEAYLRLADMFGVATDYLRDRDTKEKDTQSLSFFNCENPGYRKWAKDKKYDMYSPRSPRFHLIHYANEYALQHSKMLWVSYGIAKARHALLFGSSVVVTDLRAYDDLREYKALRLLAGEVGARMMVVGIDREGFKAREDILELLPPMLVDYTVHTVEGDVAATFAKVEQLLATKS
jgi:hypothetical protein